MPYYNEDMYNEDKTNIMVPEIIYNDSNKNKLTGSSKWLYITQDNNNNVKNTSSIDNTIDEKVN